MHPLEGRVAGMCLLKYAPFNPSGLLFLVRINGPLLAYQSDNKRNISFVPADIPSRNVFWSRYYGENAREGVALEVLAPEAVERLKAVSIDSKCVDCRGVITLAATECLCCAQEAAPEKK